MGDEDPAELKWIQERRQDTGIAADSDSLLCHQLAVFLPPFPPSTNFSSAAGITRKIPE